MVKILSRKGSDPTASSGALGVFDSLNRLLYPIGERYDLRLGFGSGIVEAGRRHGHQKPHLHVMVAEGRAREAYLPKEAAVFEDLGLRFGHTLRDCPKSPDRPQTEASKADETARK
jgi:hypothetical protein